MTLACQPEGFSSGDRESRTPGAGPIGDHSVECDIIASQPYWVDGPEPDWRPGFYRFTSRAQADVTCIGKAHLIKMTVVFQHRTNGHQGAVTGPDSVCSATRRCRALADYRRDRLNCNQVYHYDDYGHVTAWYKRDAGSPEVRIRKESRHKIGNSYNPPYPCKWK